MPSQLFVDSEEENDEFDSGSDNDFSDNDNDNDDDADISSSMKEAQEEEDGDSSTKTKKRKSRETKREAKNRKKLRKLGPKQPKGSRKEETLTKEEIKELSSQEYAHYSNLYNVQIDEVLQETSISEKRREEIFTWFEDFKKFLKSLSRSKAVSPQDFQSFLKSVKIPLPDKVYAEAKDLKVNWRQPSSVEIRGSWASDIDTALEKVSPLDVFLEMSGDYLVKSDFKNHRYHLKRAFYLAFLAKKLKQRGGSENDNLKISFTLANGELLKPVLSLKVNKVKVLIHAVPPRNYFSLQKLNCERNNLRYDHFFRKPKPEDEPDSSTQHYNFTILQDVLSNEIHEETSSFLKDRPMLQNAIKLLKIWLTQRELAKGYGAFSGFIITQFLRYLHKEKKVHENMTVFQLIRVFFINLIQLNLVDEGISFGGAGNGNEEALRLARLQWDVIILDKTGTLNYTANMSKYTYRRVQQEARAALTILDGANVTGFMALFVTRVKFMMSFDHVICLTDIKKLEDHFSQSLEDQSVLLDHSGYIYPLVTSNVGSLVEKGLNARVSLLDCELPSVPEWSVEESFPERIPEVIRIGLNINRELSQRLIEKCESESEEKIFEFKGLWGHKVELRRFKDGSMLESVALENLMKGLGRNRICYQMTSYLLKRHLNYDLEPQKYIDMQLESLVENTYLKLLSGGETEIKKKIYLKGKLAKEKIIKAPVQEEPVDVDRVARHISNSFDHFSKILRQLEELPLQISTVQGTSAVLRFSDIQPTPPQTFYRCKVLTEIDPKKKAMLLRKSVPTKKAVNASEKVEIEEKEEKIMEESVEEEVLVPPSKVPKYVEPVGVMIHLETSGKWPDNMEAIERLKCAFLIKIGQLLGEKFGLTVQTYSRHLDVLKDGVVFRLRITYLRELTLLKQLRGPDGILKIRDNPESLRLERERLILPQLTSTLRAFHLQNEAFGRTCRIAKRWVASQLLLSSPMEYNKDLEDPDIRLSEEAVELLVSHVFLNYAPHLGPPNEAHVGFQRFLNLLADTDFHAYPIILNFTDKLTSQDISEIELEFVKMRSTLPALFISCPFDRKGSVWTRNLSPIILGRLQLLAKQALQVLENFFQSVADSPVSELIKIFKPVTTQFDVILKLKHLMNPRSYQNASTTKEPLRFHQYRKQLEEYIPVVQFDPVQMYLAELRQTFGHMAIFLHDLYGGNYIAVVWKPEFFKACNFSSASVKGRQLGKDGDNIVANVAGALESFELMGQGLIEEVLAQGDRWKIED